MKKLFISFFTYKIQPFIVSLSVFLRIIHSMCLAECIFFASFSKRLTPNFFSDVFLIIKKKKEMKSIRKKQ